MLKPTTTKLLKNNGHFSVKEYKDMTREELAEHSKLMHTPEEELLNPEERKAVGEER